MKNVEQIKIDKKMTVNELVLQMGKSGVMGAGRLSKAVDVAEAMIKDKNCKVFFGLAGAMVPGGMRSIIAEMLKYRWIDVFVTTGANLTHDLVEALGYEHYQGYSEADDKQLNKQGIDRIYDSFMPNEVYKGLEKFCQQAFKKMPAEEMSIKEFLWHLGSFVKDKDSILRICSENKIPIFCPAISDSGIGLQVWQYLQEHKLKVMEFYDLKEILDIAWTCKKAGVLYVGGGVPKNHIQQAMQFSPKSASYAIQITTDRPEPGGSSGAPLKEGISWGKLDSKANYVDVFCDATIVLPIMHAALKERIKK